MGSLAFAAWPLLLGALCVALPPVPQKPPVYSHGTKEKSRPAQQQASLTSITSLPSPRPSPAPNRTFCPTLLPDEPWEEVQKRLFGKDGPLRFAIWSPAFPSEGEIADQYCCMHTKSEHGGVRKNSPQDSVRPSFPMEWRRPPINTSSYVLLMEHEQSGLVHWLVKDIPDVSSGLVEGASENFWKFAMPPPSREMNNSWGRANYKAPCPNKGGTHTYRIRLFARDVRKTVFNSSVAVNGKGDSIISQLERDGHTLDVAELRVERHQTSMLPQRTTWIREPNENLLMPNNEGARVVPTMKKQVAGVPKIAEMRPIKEQ